MTTHRRAVTLIEVIIYVSVSTLLVSAGALLNAEVSARTFTLESRRALSQDEAFTFAFMSFILANSSSISSPPLNATSTSARIVSSGKTYSAYFSGGLYVGILGSEKRVEEGVDGYFMHDNELGVETLTVVRSRGSKLSVSKFYSTK